MKKYLLEIEQGEGQLSQEDISLFKIFIEYCYNNLKIIEPPLISLLIKRPEDITTGGYDMNDNHVLSYTKHRHIIDICRSVSHELMHADQVQNNRLEVDDEDSVMCPSEQEATVFAAKMMREFSKLYPEIYRE